MKTIPKTPASRLVVRNYKVPPGATYVGRNTSLGGGVFDGTPGHYGNPSKMRKNTPAEHVRVVREFEDWIRQRPAYVALVLK
jgi:hypothetical protein